MATARTRHAAPWHLPALAWNHGLAIAEARGDGKPGWVHRAHQAYWALLWGPLLAVLLLMTLSPWHTVYARTPTTMMCVWRRRRAWHLFDFTSYPRGTGEGSHLLEDVLAAADRQGVRVTLDTRTRRLARFYGRHGFKVIQGHPGKQFAMVRPNDAEAAA